MKEKGEGERGGSYSKKNLRQTFAQNMNNF